MLTITEIVLFQRRPTPEQTDRVAAAPLLIQHMVFYCQMACLFVDPSKWTLDGSPIGTELFLLLVLFYSLATTEPEPNTIQLNV